MKIKRIKIMLVIGVMWSMVVNQTFAFDRNAAIAGARSLVSANYTYNVVTNVVTAGPVQAGSSNKNLPAYQSVAQITAQIQALKLQLKNLSPK